MWNVIPQLFYDFLARIVPGITLILFTILVISGHDSILAAEKSSQITFIHMCLLLLGAYLVGFLMGQVSDVFYKCFLKKKYNVIEKQHKQECLDQHNKVLKAMGKPELRLKIDDLPTTPFMRDNLRHVEPADAARLLKGRAERRLCEVFTVGFIIIWILDIIVFFSVGRNLERTILLFCLPLLVVICWFRALRGHRHITGGTTVGWLFSALPKF